MKLTVTLDLDTLGGNRVERDLQLHRIFREAIRVGARKLPAMRSLFNEDGDAVGFAFCFTPDEAQREPLSDELTFDPADDASEEQILPVILNADEKGKAPGG